jgi:hypothetical protein
MSSHFLKNILPLLHSLSTSNNPAEPNDTPSNKGGRPAILSPSEIVVALTWHVLQGCGVFSYNVTQLYAKPVSDAALSERRTLLGIKPWTDALARFLIHTTDGDSLPGAFYMGLRLVGIDGTTFNVSNTPTVKATTEKIKSRKGESAFFRLSAVALAALASHRPLAVKIGSSGESEGALAQQLICALAGDDLLIADRYYGNGKWLGRLESLSSKPFYLLRVKERLDSRWTKTLSDGSRFVEVFDPISQELILVREIKARIKRPGNQWTEVRFWTNLMNEESFPAKDLVALYALRWEQEITFREIKEYLHGSLILKSHTLPTAVQEICALFMAQTIVVCARVAAAQSQALPVLEVSFKKTLEGCRNICWLWAMLGDELTSETWAKIEDKVRRGLKVQATKPRRKRTCPRKVRQPVTKWPRLLQNEYQKGEIQCEIRKP